MNRRAVLIGAGGAVIFAGAGIGATFLSTGSMADYQAAAARLRTPLRHGSGLEELVRHASLAANSHNTQPWRFRLSKDAIEIVPDLSRRTPAVDPDDHHLFVSLGCAAENLAIAADASGRIGEIEIPENGAHVRYVFAAADPKESPLLDAIHRRQSSRADYDGRPLPASELSALAKSAQAPGVNLTLLTGQAELQRIRDLVVAGNSEQMADAAFMQELKHWLRFNPASAMATGDGLFAAVSGNPVLPNWLGRPAIDLFFTASAENDKYARQMASSAGVAVFTADRPDKMHWIQVGRACQRFALVATSLGLRHAFINQPVEVAGLRGELASLLGEPAKRPDVVMRFGRGPLLPFSLRRASRAIID